MQPPNHECPRISQYCVLAGGTVVVRRGSPSLPGSTYSLLEICRSCAFVQKVGVGTLHRLDLHGAVRCKALPGPNKSATLKLERQPLNQSSHDNFYANTQCMQRAMVLLGGYARTSWEPLRIERQPTSQFFPLMLHIAGSRKDMGLY